MHFLVSKYIHLLLFSSLLLLSQDPISADPTFIVCPPETSNYTLGSQFETNLNRLLPLLSPNGSINLNSYYNYTYSKDPNIVYGYSQCMSGATELECNECLNNSRVEIIRRCSNKMEAVIRYYECILRYSNRPFFSQSDSSIRRALILTQDATNTTFFNEQLGSLMRGLKSEAASKQSKFATGNIYLNVFQNIYGLAQCTRDLSADNCIACLDAMVSRIPQCCDRKMGGNIYSVSCNIRYDPYLFFANSPPPPLPPPTSPPPPIADPPPKGETVGGRKNESRTVIIIVVSVVIPLVIISTICACLWTRSKAIRRKPDIRDDMSEDEITSMGSLTFDLGTLITAPVTFLMKINLEKGASDPFTRYWMMDLA